MGSGGRCWECVLRKSLEECWRSEVLGISLLRCTDWAARNSRSGRNELDQLDNTVGQPTLRQRYGIVG